MEGFYLKKFKELEGREKHHIEAWNGFATLADLDTEVEMNSAWETIRENINISAKESLGYCELKEHKP
jgi:hypothetical protein